MTTAIDKLATEGFGKSNLPYASISAGSMNKLVVRLGDHAIDLGKLLADEDLGEAEKKAVAAENLDELLKLGRKSWSAVRQAIITALEAEGSAEFAESISTDVSSAEYAMPFSPADYVDYYASENHATNIGKMFRPDEAALKPNWKHLPVGYHGRSGTIIVSGTEIVRPSGLRPGEGGIPSFGPSQRLDIEAEMGFVCGGAPAGTHVSVAEADEYIFGAFLFNDWSARDIQAFEYVPLGPNLGKSFASSVGAWVVPFEALKDARVEPPEREFEVADYLKDDESTGGPWGLDILMEVDLNGEVVSRPPYATMYWTAPQMLAHMTVNGGSLRPGDMYGSGTVSGPERDQRGSFIELSWGGKEPLKLKDGSDMVFLQDGQTVTLRATAPGADGETINFGDCVGTIVAADS
ncbi:fumarylacetoacetate hydrolase family protein [Brevibacterium ravenspurgense]|uniref:fumarylacetoacetate hydrolase family protein n=1 Tax=Brevibacterium ravenspurgense TaxID=479117 RepID=UPI001EF29246|nr:fumarylacetoacetate hydrolase family protein [Brevibacterium ravenspurgense]MCG7300554.1 fumarylacetoacetate hydrolase family protein [Brevibacterium ravenspurgense]